MRSYLVVIFCSLILYSGQGIAQTTDSVSTRKNWAPHYAKLQFAGAIGFLSAGAGYVHARGKMETELMLGFLPKSIGGDHLISMTAKTNWLPGRIELKENVLQLIPFQMGGYLSYTFGSEFDTFLPDQYPRGYYWWASSLRVGMFVGSRLRWLPSETGKRGPVDFYYEIGTYDLKLISYVQNISSLSLLDIINISAGVKIEL